MRISDWSSDVRSSDLRRALQRPDRPDERVAGGRRQSRFAQDGGGDQHAQLLGIAADRALACRRQRLLSGARHDRGRSEEHTSELQSLIRISYTVFCLKKKKKTHTLSPNYSQHTYQTK